MKKHWLCAAVAATLICSMSMTSCIGSFTLTNKLLNWNRHISNKFVNELVFFAFWVLPVYEVSGLADLIVLNSIEFWSGSNPVAKGTKIIEGNDGRYLVKCDGKGYTIKSETDGSVVRLDFHDTDRSWSVKLPDGTDQTILTYIDDTHVSLPAADGATMTVELSDAGLLAYSRVAMSQQLALN
ncbi:MAG: DUF3332 domain-containing protein [Bacteroides sp.]|nr:DUF3332 domain-containing protein [Bacteroides sp.]MCM1094834.1 DUF3332 domain-containing protein [Terasakiella sp.]